MSQSLDALPCHRQTVPVDLANSAARPESASRCCYRQLASVVALTLLAGVSTGFRKGEASRAAEELIGIVHSHLT